MRSNGISATLLALIGSFILISSVSAQEALRRVRISYPEPTDCCFPLLAAYQWKIFGQNGLKAEIVLMESRLANPALLSGDIDFVAGVGPNSVSGTLRGMATRAVWFASNQLEFVLVAKPEFRQLSDLRGRKIGLPALGGTSDVALTIALQDVGEKRNDFTFLPLAGQLFSALATGVVDGALLSPPWIFHAERKGFREVLNVGSRVKMPLGGLTTLLSTIKTRPDETKRVILSLQQAQKTMLQSQEKSVDLIVQFLKVDRETAEKSYRLYKETTSDNNGVPSRAGMARIVEAIQMLGQFRDRKIAFEEIADDRIAREVAKDLGYKVD